jgi:hypothetical protein
MNDRLCSTSKGGKAGSEGGQNHLGFPLFTAGRMDFVRLKILFTGSALWPVARLELAGSNRVE